MAVRMYVADLTIDRSTKNPILVLADEPGGRRLSIYIGLMEASAIAAAKEKIDLPRPMTHDLMTDVLAQLGAALESVEVCDLREGTYYAVLRLRRGELMVEVDSRPSDAIALALRSEAPIFVDEAVLADAGEPQKDKWIAFLESLDPDDFGKYRM